MDLPFALEGFFFEKVNGSTGQRVTFTFHYIIYAPASRHTLQKAPFALLALLQSLIRCLLLRCISTAYVGVPSKLLLRGSFSKSSTGRRVNGSTGQPVNGSLSLSLYYI